MLDLIKDLSQLLMLLQDFYILMTETCQSVFGATSTGLKTQSIMFTKSGV